MKKSCSSRRVAWQTLAWMSALATAATIIGGGAYFHFFVRPICDIRQRNRAANLCAVLLLFNGWFAARHVYYGILLAGKPGGEYPEATHEAPILANYVTRGRGLTEGFVTVAIDPMQSPIWNLQNYRARDWQPQDHHCLHFAVLTTTHGVRFIYSDHLAPCSRTWPALGEAERAVLTAYLANNSALHVRYYVDASKAGLESHHCSTGYHAATLIYDKRQGRLPGTP